MANVSFHVTDGVDKGRVFLHIETPITIGREEGNIIRLNDERVSRFHAKVQDDHGTIVLTDLDSTNGTSVNGEPVQLRVLRPGDRVCVGRSTLVFGTVDEIAQFTKRELAAEADKNDKTMLNIDQMEESVLGVTAEGGPGERKLDVFEREPPELPIRLSPAQAAQLSEVIDFLHRALADATSKVHVPDRGIEATLPIAHWQRVQTVLIHLSRYSRLVANPETAKDS